MQLQNCISDERIIIRFGSQFFPVLAARAKARGAEVSGGVPRALLPPGGAPGGGGLPDRRRAPLYQRSYDLKFLTSSNT